MSELNDTKAVVVGASRGFGRGIAEALVEAGVDVSRCHAATLWSSFVRPVGGSER